MAGLFYIFIKIFFMKMYLSILAIFFLTGVCAGQNPQDTRPSESSVNPSSTETEFRNMRTFFASGSMPIPKGVKRIMIEAWGAGGGGTVMGGGGGGAYGKAVIEISEGNTLVIDVGKGGQGHLTVGVNGEPSSVSFKTALSGPVILFRVWGGTGFDNSIGNAANGFGGNKAEGRTSSIGFTYLPGEDGSVYHDYSRQSGTGSIVTRSYGKGGNAANAPYTGGRGSITDFATSGSVTNIRLGSDGKVPGGGGGASYAQRGFNGAGGMVIVYY
jgi:hypothetical protein